jgi:hypothetical protein
MKTLSERLVESSGQPILLDGELVLPIHRIDLPPGTHVLELRWISCREELHPGLSFRLTNGSALIADQKLERFKLWAKTSPRVIRMAIKARKRCQLSIWNIWSINGVTEAWTGQAGMKISAYDQSTLMRCSGGSARPDFEALVVEMVLGADGQGD